MKGASGSNAVNTQKGRLPARKCFFITPLGDEGSYKRFCCDRIRSEILEPVLEVHRYQVTRGDDPVAGRIMPYVMKCIRESDLAIIDVTGGNPNVFFELALWQATCKPFLIIKSKGEKIAFDVQDMRAVDIDLENTEVSRNKLNKLVDRLARGAYDPKSISVIGSEPLVLVDLPGKSASEVWGGWEYESTAETESSKWQINSGVCLIQFNETMADASSPQGNLFVQGIRRKHVIREGGEDRSKSVRDAWQSQFADVTSDGRLRCDFDYEGSTGEVYSGYFVVKLIGEKGKVDAMSGMAYQLPPRGVEGHLELTRIAVSDVLPELDRDPVRFRENQIAAAAKFSPLAVDAVARLGSC